MEGEAKAGTAQGTPAYRRYLLFIMLIGYSLNFLDRQIISILLEPIKQDLHLSDTMLGFLSGLSFALFYATLGIPIAALADRRSRRAIVSISMAVWSVMTAACGLAQNFVQLLLARFGVGVGEAGFTPATLSMIADYFPKEQRATAVAVTSTGAMLGVMLGLVIGGVVAQNWGWRAAMLVAGVPGILFALVFWLTVREPVRGLSDGLRARAEAPSLWASAAALWRIRSYRYIALGAGISAACLYGYSIWLPSLLARSYGMKPAEIGFLLGPVLGGVGAAGALVSGYLCDRLMRRDLRWTVWVPAIASAIAMVAVAASLNMDGVGPLIALYAIGYFLSMFFSASTSAIIQSLVPIEMRATGVAWKMLMVNLVGLGLGPQAIGALSHALSATEGGASLRTAMLVATPVFLLASILYCMAARFIRADAEAVIAGAERQDRPASG